MRPAAWWALVVGVVACFLGGVSIARLRDDGDSAALWITTSDGRLRIARQRDLPLQAAGARPPRRPSPARAAPAPAATGGGAPPHDPRPCRGAAPGDARVRGLAHGV